MEEWRESELDMFGRFRRIFAKHIPNRDAARFCEALVYIAHLWDDLIDGDKQRSHEEINTAFTLMLGEIPLNPFYQQHIKTLAPLLMSVCINWRTANVLERIPVQGLRLTAWQIRQEILLIFHHCLYLVRGADNIIENSVSYWDDVGRYLDSNLLDFVEETKRWDAMEAEAQA